MVHRICTLNKFPTVQAEWIDENLELMDLYNKVFCPLFHSCVKLIKIKVRPAIVENLDSSIEWKTREQIRSVNDLIKSEVNIKSVEYPDDASGYLLKSKT